MQMHVHPALPTALTSCMVPLPRTPVQQQQRPPSRGNEDEERPEEEHAEKDEKVGCGYSLLGGRTGHVSNNLHFCACKCPNTGWHEEAAQRRLPSPCLPTPLLLKCFHFPCMRAAG